MKRTLLNALLIGLITFSACNSASNDKTGNSSKSVQSSNEASAADDKDIKVVNAKYTGVDEKVTGSINELVQHYVHLKNALAGDDAKEAGAAAKALIEAFAKADQGSLPEDQKSLLKDNGEELKENADHIAKKTGDIAQQRKHFAMLSEDIYAIVTAFGAGKTLYHEHCPMYNDNKGALWLSESKEIKNPYYGSKMLKCGEVKEVIK